MKRRKDKNELSWLTVVAAVVLAISTTGLLIWVIPASTGPGGIADVVEEVLPATVHIFHVGVCQGSGFLVSPDGLVVTAKHVVEYNTGIYRVTLNDGRAFGVRTVLISKDYDVAFLRLDMDSNTPLPFVGLGDITKLRVGDPVFIVGSPFGYENFNSVTLGILSSAQRDLDKPWNYGYGWTVTFQTDATAEPGNSGGPVFNLNGEAVGILVAGMDATVNYSVPTNVFSSKLLTIKRLLEEDEFEVLSPDTEVRIPEWEIYLCPL